MTCAFVRDWDFIRSNGIAGQYAIKINDQYRICFAWIAGDATEVEITDYH
jgi:plasmid maintenance system killer protein